MPLLKWKPEYSVNEAVLDNDHKKLFDLLNIVYENATNSLEVDGVLPVINELSEYTKYHLSAEEQFMRENGFQEIEAHIAEHREFTHKIETLKSLYHVNNLDVAEELIIVLGDWLLHHALKEDMKYFGLSKSIGESAKVFS